MKANLTVLAVAFLGLASAASQKRRSTLQDRVSRRSNSALPIQDHSVADAEYHEDLSTNIWAGAIYLQPVDGIPWNGVSGTVVAPVPSVPAGADPTGSYSAAAWVGIDGLNTDSILQTGFDWTISNGAVSYSAWYECK